MLASARRAVNSSSRAPAAGTEPSVHGVVRLHFVGV
jgi:hypothetical protein